MVIKYQLWQYGDPNYIEIFQYLLQFQYQNLGSIFWYCKIINFLLEINSWNFST